MKQQRGVTGHDSSATETPRAFHETTARASTAQGCSRSRRRLCLPSRRTAACAAPPHPEAANVTFGDFRRRTVSREATNITVRDLSARTIRGVDECVLRSMVNHLVDRRGKAQVRWSTSWLSIPWNTCVAALAKNEALAGRLRVTAPEWSGRSNRLKACRHRGDPDAWFDRESTANRIDRGIGSAPEYLPLAVDDAAPHLHEIVNHRRGRGLDDAR